MRYAGVSLLFFELKVIVNKFVLNLRLIASLSLLAHSAVQDMIKGHLVSLS